MGKRRVSTDHSRPDNRFHYPGFAGPNGTIVPDDVFDVLAPRLSEAELRVLLYIIRRTFGFGKNADAISLRQLTDGIVARDGRILDYGTGMSRKGVIGGIKGLLDKGVITVRKAVAQDGDHEVNVYSLRFREGVVTGGNYPGNPSTLPVVTGGNPQDSVVQDSVRQHHARGWSLGSGETGGPVVAAIDNTFGRPDLYETLRELGVHHHTASKLLREQDHGLIERMCEYVQQRLEGGWAPQESIPAWLVAAIRRRYDLPAEFKTRREQAAEAEQEQAARLEAWKAEERAQARWAEELRQQRRGRLAALGIPEAVDEVWQQAQAKLRESGEWSLGMPQCLLQSLEHGVAVLLVPAKIRSRLEGHLDAIARALGQVRGEPVQVVVRELG